MKLQEKNLWKQISIDFFLLKTRLGYFGHEVILNGYLVYGYWVIV